VLVTALIVDSIAHMPVKVAVDLAGTNHAIAMPDALDDDSLLIAVTRDDRIFLGPFRVGPHSLPQAIRDTSNYSAQRRVYIRADKRAHYGSIKQVLEGVRAAGMERVAFLVDGTASKSTHSQFNR